LQTYNYVITLIYFGFDIHTKPWISNRLQSGFHYARWSATSSTLLSIAQEYVRLSLRSRIQKWNTNNM